MNQKHLKKLALGAAIAGSLAAGSAAQASPFALTTLANASSAIADLEIVFKPNTDLAIWNYLAREIVERVPVDEEFVKKHCVFASGPVDIGFGMRPSDAFAFPAERDTPARETVVVLSREEGVSRVMQIPRRCAPPPLTKGARTSAAHAK